MLKKGYVERLRSSEDERSLIVSVTDKGEELKEQAASIPSKISKCVSLEPEEAMNLYRILHKIMDGFK